MNILESKKHLKECQSQILSAKKVLLSNIDKNLAIDLLNNSLILLTLVEILLDEQDNKTKEVLDNAENMQKHKTRNKKSKRKIK